MNDDGITCKSCSASATSCKSRGARTVRIFCTHDVITISACPPPIRKLYTILVSDHSCGRYISHTDQTAAVASMVDEAEGRGLGLEVRPEKIRT